MLSSTQSLHSGVIRICQSLPSPTKRSRRLRYGELYGRAALAVPITCYQWFSFLELGLMHTAILQFGFVQNSYTAAIKMHRLQCLQNYHGMLHQTSFKKKALLSGKALIE